MARLPEDVLKGIRSKDVFTTYFLSAHQEADGYLHHLRFGPYLPKVETMVRRAEEEEDDTPIVLSDSASSSYKKGSAGESPDMDTRSER